MRGNWSKECCTECGEEGLASRGCEVVNQSAYVCDDCQIYAEAYEAGRSSAGVVNLKGLIGSIAVDQFACPNEECLAEASELCVTASGNRYRMIHAGRWRYAEEYLRPHTHPGLKIVR